MAWNTIRKATDEDSARLMAAAQRFMATHFPSVDTDDVADTGEMMAMVVEAEIDAAASIDPHGNHARLRNLWRAAVRRALREPACEGIAYGYVGRHAA